MKTTKRLNKKHRSVKTIILAMAMSIMVSVPVFAAKTVYPNSNLSTSSTKYYSQTYTYKVYNNFDQVLFTYKFTPVWRINKSNSITSKSSASTYSTGIPLSLWRLADSAYSWYGYEYSGLRVLERYYAEGICIGWGVGLEAEVGISASKEPFEATVSVSADLTVGQYQGVKFQAVAAVGKNWSSCNYGYQLYR